MKRAKEKPLTAILEYALNLERNGKAFFQNSLERVENPNAVAAIDRLVEEEEGHIQILTATIARVKEGETSGLAGIIERAPKPARYFDRKAQQAFLKEIRENPAVPDITVFQTAWLIEKEICGFYEKAAEKSDGGVQKVLLSLYEFEKEHAAFFWRYYDELNRLYIHIYDQRPWA